MRDKYDDDQMWSTWLHVADGKTYADYKRELNYRSLRDRLEHSTVSGTSKTQEEQQIAFASQYITPKGGVNRG